MVEPAHAGSRPLTVAAPTPEDLLARVLERAEQALAHASSRRSWVDGARLIEITMRVRKLMAETPPSARVVTAATSLARALIEATVEDDDEDETLH